MQQQGSDVEFRLSELQTQLDRLSVALHLWQQAPEHPTEEHLSQLLAQCAETLNRVKAIDERHSEAVAKLESRLNDWSFIESRLEQDSDQRIRQFEQIIGHEWEALRKLHEQPARELREQAASLGETCVAAANLALRGFDRAEARLAALEAGLQDRMTQLSRELHAAVAEQRSGSPAPSASLPADLSPFPLDSVLRIHDGVRRSDEAVDPPVPPARVPLTVGSSGALPPKTRLQLPEAAARISGRIESLAYAAAGAHKEARSAPVRTDGMRRTRRATIIVAALGVIGGSVLVFWLQRRVEARLNDAAVRVAVAEREAETATQLANRRIAETEEATERQLAEARQTALQAQIVSSVLAAPDLTRINLGSGPVAPRAFGHILWSRSRGLVLSASRVPTPRVDATYQLWLVTSSGVLSAGTFSPDSAGRATLATDDPPNLPRPVASAFVTLEAAGGVSQPTGARALTRAQ